MQEHYESLGRNAANYVALTPLSFLARTADLFPEREAVIYGALRLSWGDVQRRANRLASALIKRGVEVGDTVAVLSPNTPAMFDAHFGVPLAGAVLNTINFRLEASTIAYILDHGDAKVLLTDTAFASTVRNALSQIKSDVLVVDIDDPEGPGGEKLGQIEYEQLLEEGDEQFEGVYPGDEWQALALNYTSGTSGRPKGVVYHHRGAYLMSMGTVTAWGLTQHPRYLYSVPMFHCNGWGHAWTMALLAGTVILMRDVTAAKVFNAVADHSVTHFGGAPIVLSMLVDAPSSERREFNHDVQVMTAGAPPPPVVLEKTRALGFNVMQVYGLTETFGHVTQCLWREEWDDESSGRQAEIKSWQGVAFPMTEQVGIVDLDSDELLPRDGTAEGEIVLRGNTVMKGYYKDPAATAAAFKNGWFRSGDAAVWRQNGYMQIRDRLKDVIISGGENISSVEVEGVLYRHEAVAAAAVVAMPHEKWGEVPCAFVELKPGCSALESDIIAFCREHLAGFKTPKRVEFGELPKTATGKIQKFLLRQKIR
ncbi:MAG: AMP-binding protein [Gammaproteobacteria bacterium]